MKENLVILGSTGSIGLNTLEVIEMHQDKFNVFAISANSSVEVLISQCEKFNPSYVHITKEADAKKIKLAIEKLDLQTKIIFGKSELNNIVSHERVDTVVCAISGSAGLESSLNAVKSGKKILLANKESLVMCGKLFIEMAEKYDSLILPVDSEHNAIHQCLSRSEDKSISKIILTASGGPFFKTSLNEFKNITLDQALKHPTWKMGPKISIDSATMMNKGLEIIEAMHLFSLEENRIEVLVHPQSIVHSAVCYEDGSIITQISQNDMRVPISYCLGWPQRIDSGIKLLNLVDLPPLEFHDLAKDRYPCFFLAREVAKEGDSLPTAMNAANEIAVDAFINGKIGFKDIYSIIDKVVEHHEKQKITSIEDVLRIDDISRNNAIDYLKRYN